MPDSHLTPQPAGKAASRASWKTLPLPKRREKLEVTFPLTHEQAQRVRDGHIPEGMDDRWFIFHEDGAVYFHRSWTGACIFGAKLTDAPEGGELAECWVSREHVEYRSQGDDHDSALLAELVDSYFLNPVAWSSPWMPG